MKLELDERERAALLHALDNYIPQLTAEAARSEAHDVEHDLWKTRDCLERLRERLQSEGPFDLPAPH